MFKELVLEIGTEEIPSDYLNRGLIELKRLAESYLKVNRIEVNKDLTTYGTPRRLVIVGTGVAKMQQDAVQEMIGPPRKAAFDEQGNPTKAAHGFAKKHGVSVEELQTLETPKGEYLYVKREMPGRQTLDLLSEILPEVIANIPWPKSMRWGSQSFSFVRPIHWILALFNGRVIPFEVAGIRSGNKTVGHRFMAPHHIEIHSFHDYLQKMSEASVIIDRIEREKQVEKGAAAAALQVSGTILKDLDLLGTVTNMVEYPSAMFGSFDRKFLTLPQPVLITAMKKHQRYFSIQDMLGQLMPHFVAVNNTIPRDEVIVRKGHERVLRARLADAEFFFKEDRKRPLAERLEDLKTVIYQAQLGTSFAKVQRFTVLAKWLAEQIAPEKIDKVRLAAKLSKCDLVTEMVMEFPSLQGIMGEEYARLDGHPEDVCLAISEHYLPVQAESDLPESSIGAIVGMADRMDTIAGCFAVGLEPTGTADPYALRRQTLAIIRVIRDKRIAVSIPDFVSTAVSTLGETLSFNSAEVIAKVLIFIKERFMNMLLAEGYAHDLIDAVVTVNFDFLDQVEDRIEAVKRCREVPEDFEPLVMAFKRIANIVKGNTGISEVKPELFDDKSEEDLWEAFQIARHKASKEIESKNFFGALKLMAGLNGPVNQFFSEVMVMAEESRVRENRLGMLNQLFRFFIQLADFSKLTV